MEDSLLFLLYGLIALLGLAIMGILFLGYRIVGSRGRIEKELHNRMEVWRDREVERIQREQLEIAQREAQVEMQTWKNQQEKAIRQDAIQKSKAVTLGKVTEQFIPYFPNFHYNPKDARFLGSPIDLLVFDGLDEGALRKIVLIEVKTGGSNLSTRERQIRDVVQAGKVTWEELRLEPSVIDAET